MGSPDAILSAMELYVPTGILEQLQAEKEDVLRQRAMAAVDDLQVAITAAVPRLAAVADATGGRLMTAAAFMLRANDLLRGARATESEPEVCALVLRTVFELAVVARYFVVGPHAVDEFSRRIRYGHDEEAKLAVQVGTTNAALPQFLQQVAAATSKAPRTLATLAQELDEIDRRKAGEEGSVLFCYRLLYKHVSNVLSHANALSIKRYTKGEGHLLTLRQATEPAIRTPSVLAVACFVYDLAHAVFAALEVPTGPLPAVLSRGQHE